MRGIRWLTGFVWMSLAVIIPGWVWSQPNTFDSLHALLNRTKPDTNRVRLLLSLAERYRTDRKDRSKSRLDTALLYSRQAESLSRLLGSRRLITESLMTKSKALMDSRARSSNQLHEAKSDLENVLKNYLPAGDQRQQADVNYLLSSCFSSADSARLPYLRSALKVYEASGDRRKMIDVLLEIGNTFRLTGNTPEALRLYLRSLALQKSIYDPELSFTIVAIAGLYQTMGNYPVALTYAYRAHQLALKTGDDIKIVSSLNFLASMYRTLGDEQKGIEYLTKLLELSLKSHSSQAIVRTRLNLSQSLLQLGRQPAALAQAQAAFRLIQLEVPSFRPVGLYNLGNCYKASGTYATAERYYINALTNAKSHLQTDIFLALGGLYLKTKQPAKAYSFLNKGLITAQENNANPDIKRKILLNLYRVDSIQNDPKAALAHFRAYTALNDSLFTITKSNQIASLQIQFDVENKERNIRLLQQRNAFQQSQLQQTQQEEISIAIGTLLLLLLLIVTYSRYRLKTRSNQHLQLQQQQLQAQHEELQTQQEDISDKNAHLQRLLMEKELLLKEIHHRVKNNLQIVMSLLNSQAATLHDPTALSAIRGSQHRVQAMALVHQKLYQSEGVARIGMASYVAELVAYLHESFDLPQSIRFDLQVEPIELDVTQAVPLGLIINEAITNALKHAFPDGRPGTVRVELSRLSPATYQFSITDNGVGLPVGYDPASSRSLGMILIRGFGEQLGGTLQMSGSPGLRIGLSFGDDPLNAISPYTNATY